MQNVTIELVKKVGGLPFFIVKAEDDAKTLECFAFYPEDEESTKAKAIKYAQELRDPTEYETRTLIEF